MGIADILQPFASSLTYICVLVLATFAITLIFKTSATTNFAQGTIAALGCYVTSTFLISKQWNIWLSLLMGVVFGILVGLFIDLVIFRNGRNVNLVGKQIITMGLVSIFGNGIPMIWKYLAPPIFPGLTNQLNTPPIVFNIAGKPITITVHSLICLGVTVLIVGVLFVLLRFSKWGLGVRTTASNEYVAQMMGVNTYAITAISWGIAGGLGALACVMFVGENGTLTNPFIMTEFQVNAFLAGILGGFGSFIGPVVAAIIIPLFETTIGLFANVESLRGITSWIKVISYVVVMIVIYIKPNGLFGKKVVKKV